MNELPSGSAASAAVRPPPLNALTIDVEDYFQVSAFDQHIERAEWHLQHSRIERNTHRVLELLDRYQVRATFFVLGWTADHHPHLVRDIRAAGHDVGSHSYWHRLVYRMTPGEFREDLRQSRDVLQEILGEAVTAYRAPSFSITSHCRWAFEILVEEGFNQDSSIFPVRHDRYGIPDAPPQIHRIQTPAGSITEFPPTTFRWARLRLPVAGGGYFRLLPWSWTRYCLQRVQDENHPFMFYLHPWELDPDQPRVAASAVSRFRHYVNLHTTADKLAALLDTFPLGTLSDALLAARERGVAGAFACS